MVPPRQASVSPVVLRAFLRHARHLVGVRGEVTVRIASDRVLRDLNRRFRGVDGTTDVLSFPLSAATPGRRPTLGGDVAISRPAARRQARRYGHSLDTELRILILHGLLHLAGHDHERDQGQMRRLEERLRRRLGLPCGLISRGPK
ncbi:MAG: rRNA maturation RNase YbeY [Terriglobales bacterium]